MEKINSLIQQLVSEIFARDLALKPSIFLTITKVDTTKDLRYAKIFVSIFPESGTEYIVKTLRKEKNLIQRKLHGKLTCKPLPSIEFIVDDTEQHADTVEKILASLRNEDMNV